MRFIRKLGRVEAESLEARRAQINRALDKVEQVEPVEVTDYPKSNAEKSDYMKRAREKFNGAHVRNNVTGYDIEIANSGIKHTGATSLNGSLPILDIDKLIESAAYLGAEKNTDPKKNNVKLVHQFVNTFKAGDRAYLSLVTVLEYANGKKYYNNAAIKKLPSPWQPGVRSLPGLFTALAGERSSFNSKSDLLKLTIDIVSQRGTVSQEKNTQEPQAAGCQ